MFVVVGGRPSSAATESFRIFCYAVMFHVLVCFLVNGAGKEDVMTTDSCRLRVGELNHN
jgi:hypothetical protein